MFERVPVLFLYLYCFLACVSIYMCEGGFAGGYLHPVVRTHAALARAPQLHPMTRTYAHSRTHTRACTETHPPTREDFCQNQ